MSRGRRGTPDASRRLGRRWEGGGTARLVSRDGRGDSCAQRVFHVAGVGKGVTWWVAGHRFAWQAQGIVRGS